MRAAGLEIVFAIGALDTMSRNHLQSALWIVEESPTITYCVFVLV